MSVKSVVDELSIQARANHLAFSNANFLDRLKKFPDSIVCVAEGDSWFDYIPAWFQDPLNGDLLGHLQIIGAYNIFRVSRAGDTLENMVYGTEYDDTHWTPNPPEVLSTIEAIKTYKPQIFLFSGGGNDIAGPVLESYLNHTASGLPSLRNEYMAYMFDCVIKKMFSDLIDKIKVVSPDIKIFLHGYDYPVPDGRPVLKIVPGWNFIGPWLRPAFVKKRIFEISEMSSIMQAFIDALNQVLFDVASAYDRVYYINLRGLLSDSDWANELHPTPSGFGKIARVFDEKIRAIL